MPQILSANMPDSKPSNHRARHVKLSRADIFMSIKPEHMDNIAAGLKNHEYRRYLLPATVHRIWFYTSAPVSAIHYVACISDGKIPGQVPEDGGIGNKDFNEGKKLSKYGYEIRELWKLEQPVSLQQAKSKGYLKGPPQKYCYVPRVFLESSPLEKQDNIFKIDVQALAKRRKKLSSLVAS
jgi:predicted transcriptional regulator